MVFTRLINKVQCTGSAIYRTRASPGLVSRAFCAWRRVRRDDDYLLFTHTHTQNGGRAHKGGGPVSAPRHRSRPRGRGRYRYRYRYRYRSIDRSIDRSRAWVRAWVSHGFRMGFACPNDVHPPIDVTRVGTARRIGAMSGAPSTSSAAMQAKLVRGR